MEADWHSLPAPLLAGVLQQVNTKHRLICCALVCKSWAAATAVATDSLRSLHLELCSSWVEHHKAQITSFHLPPARPQDFAVVSQLPSPLLAHLVELRVDRNRLKLAPSSSSPGLLQHASTLRALSVNACQVVDGQDGLMALRTLPNLQDLTLHVVLNLYPNRDEQLKLPSELLPGLQHLTRLCVRLTAADNWQGLQQLGQMTALRHLHLQGVHRVPHLCAGLRVLVLEDVQIPLSPASTPGMFAQLTVLQELRLQDCVALDPTVLQHMLSLQHLVLEDIQQWQPADAAEVLLAWVGKQQQLTHLELVAGQLVASSSAQGRALTASSKLQHLRFTLSLKEEAWREVFAADKQLQDLTCLRFVLDPSVCGADLSQLVSCCPRLRDLSIRASPAGQRAVIAAGKCAQHFCSDCLAAVDQSNCMHVTALVCKAGVLVGSACTHVGAS
jgi:hypothetical protein